MATFKVIKKTTTVYYVEAENEEMVYDMYSNEKHNEVVDEDIEIVQVDFNPWLP